MRVRSTNDIEDLRPLFEQWYRQQRDDNFGLSISVDGVMQDLDWWTKTFEHGLLLAVDDADSIVGMMAVFAIPNHMSPKPLAIEKYWFGAGGLQLYRAAKSWAAEVGCSHFLASASRLAGGRHDRVAKLCSKIGMKHFETTFITTVQDSQGV